MLGPSVRAFPILYDLSRCIGLTFVCYSVAGVETTATMLSYASWEISRRPDIARRLQAEIDDAMPDPRMIPDTTVLSSLPFLNAVIKESELWSPEN